MERFIRLFCYFLEGLETWRQMETTKCSYRLGVPGRSVLLTSRT